MAAVLEELQRLHPGHYPDRVLRSLQRRIAQWRATEGPERELVFRQEHRLVEIFEVDGHLSADWQPLVGCASRISRLTWIKDTRSGLWTARRDVAYYACQIRLDAPTLARAVRDHWGIENRDHHVRDRILREDDSRIRRKPGLFARLRSFALNLLRAKGVGNISQALYANALSLNRLLDFGTLNSEN